MQGFGRGEAPAKREEPELAPVAPISAHPAWRGSEVSAPPPASEPRTPLATLTEGMSRLGSAELEAPKLEQGDWRLQAAPDRAKRLLRTNVAGADEPAPGVPDADPSATEDTQRPASPSRAHLALVIAALALLGMAVFLLLQIAGG